MTGQFFISLLNPAIALLFAAAFAVIWRKQPRRRHLMLLTVGFASSGMAFILQDMVMPIENGASRLVANGLFVLAVVAICAAAIARASGKVPVAALAAIALSGLAALAWYIYADPNLLARIVSINGALTLLVAVTLGYLLAAKPRSPFDWAIVVVAALALAIAVLRLGLAAFGAHDFSSYEGFQQSVYWTTVQLFASVLTVILGLLFMASTAADVLGELRSQANADPLSGLLNRRGFEAAASALFEKNEAGSWPMSILLADLDDFKTINDTFGHKAGDNVIATVGRILSEHGDAAVAGRIGGEEFALFYCDVPRSELQAIAMGIQIELDRQAIPGIPEDYAATMSIGIYTRHHADTLPDMLDGADRALYEAKRGGKNRVELAPLSLRTIPQA